MKKEIKEPTILGLSPANHNYFIDADTFVIDFKGNIFTEDGQKIYREPFIEVNTNENFNVVIGVKNYSVANDTQIDNYIGTGYEKDLELENADEIKEWALHQLKLSYINDLSHFARNRTEYGIIDPEDWFGEIIVRGKAVFCMTPKRISFSAPDYGQIGTIELTPKELQEILEQLPD